MARRRFTVTIVGGSPAVVAKVAGPAGVAALAHEAEVLAAVRHPGVVEVVGVHRSDDSMVLATALAGVHTVASAPALTAGRAVRAVGQLLAVVAHLHGAGLCHGRITPDHVVVGPAGGIRLCGLGLSTPASVQACADDLAHVRQLGEALLGQAGRTLGASGRSRRVRLLDDCRSVLHRPGLDAGALAGMLARQARR